MLETLQLLASARKKKKPTVIKCSCGIGDTDGFPALDATSDSYSLPEDYTWGFRITGGAEFHMPITVFQVTECGLADSGGIRLGDIILEINEVDATNLTLKQAHQIIDEAESKLHIVAKKMEEEVSHRKQKNENKSEEEEEEFKSIVLRRKLPPKIPDPPKEFRPTPLLGTKVWHPIMCELPRMNPNEIRPGEEDPHKRIIRNIKRFFTETKDNPELHDKVLQDILIVLPK